VHEREAELAVLCQSCGMCCDGSLFGWVRLEPAEVEAARKRGLPVLDGAKGFEQPCPALVPAEGTDDARRKCSVYAERPGACRRFECRLHDRHRTEGGPLEPRLAAVRRVRELIALLQAASPWPADGETERPHAADPKAFDELMQRLEDFAQASESAVDSAGVG